MTTRTHPVFNLLVLLLAVGMAGSASAETMEERLRNQLRTTTQQLQTLQSAQAQNTAALQAAQQAAQTQLSAAQAQVKQLTAELAKARSQSEQLSAQQDTVRSSAQAHMAASSEQIAKFKLAYEELLGRARGIETARAGLETDLASRNTEVQQCVAKNQQMYGIAKDILSAYENIEVSDVLKIRQPFASDARVKFEELAQRYGDALYQTQFDATTATAGK